MPVPGPKTAGSVDIRFVTFTAGSRLGPYEVVALLGAGGMSACGSRGARTRDARASGGGAPRALRNALRAQAALGIPS